MATIEIIESVEIGKDVGCGLCGEIIPAWQSHNEEVELKDGHVEKIVMSFHEEC